MDAAVRQPLQDRSRKSLEKVMAAGIEVLGKKGYDGFSIADVSQRSGVSVGSIYQRFQSKAVLFAALQVRILEEIDREQAVLFSTIKAERLTDEQILAAAVKKIADLFMRHEPLIRVMILRGAVEEETRLRGSQSSLLLARSFEAFLMASVRRFGHDNPELGCDVCFRIVYAALTRRIMSGPTFESPTEIPWRVFVQELCRVCIAYLLGTNPPAGVSSP